MAFAGQLRQRVLLLGVFAHTANHLRRCFELSLAGTDRRLRLQLLPLLLHLQLVKLCQASVVICPAADVFHSNLQVVYLAEKVAARLVDLRRHA